MKRSTHATLNVSYQDNLNFKVGTFLFDKINISNKNWMLSINYQETMIKDWALTDFENTKFTQIQNKYAYLSLALKKYQSLYLYYTYICRTPAKIQIGVILMHVTTPVAMATKK